MSENTAWQDIVQASHRLESNIDSYEHGYKKGRKDEREHAKTLRNPDRLAEIQHLQEALRRKNEKYRRLRAQYKRLKDSKRPRARAHAYINRTGGAGRFWAEYEWEATVIRGARWYDAERFPTHHEALQWALARLKEQTGERRNPLE